MYKVPEDLQKVSLVKGQPSDGKIHTTIIPAGALLEDYLTHDGLAILDEIHRYAQKNSHTRPIRRRIEIYSLPVATETTLDKKGRKCHVDPTILAPDALYAEGTTIAKGMYVGNDDINTYSFPLYFVIRNWRHAGREFESERMHTYSLGIATNWTIYEFIDEPIPLDELYKKHPSCLADMQYRTMVNL
jgi:hypothetical protein